MNDDELQTLLGVLRPLCARELGPHAKRWDAERRLDDGLAGRLAEWGLIGVSVDESRGGAGAGMVGAASVVEEIASHSGSVAVRVALHEGAAVGLALVRSDDAALAAAMNPRGFVGWLGPDREPTARGLTMVAGGDGDMVVARRIGDRTTVRVVAGDAMTRRLRESSGLRAAGWADLATLGGDMGDTAGDGRHEAAWISARVAVLLGAVASGLARAAVGEAARYAMVREQFGSTLASFQAIQWKIANSATERDAAWGLVQHAAARLDRLPPGRDLGRVAAAAARSQLAAVRSAVVACSEALQVHGGYGYTEEFAIERLLRDARACSAVDRNDHELHEALVPSIVERFA